MTKKTNLIIPFFVFHKLTQLAHSTSWTFWKLAILWVGAFCELVIQRHDIRRVRVQSYFDVVHHSHVFCEWKQLLQIRCDSLGSIAWIDNYSIKNSQHRFQLSPVFSYERCSYITTLFHVDFGLFQRRFVALEFHRSLEKTTRPKVLITLSSGFRIRSILRRQRLNKHLTSTYDGGFWRVQVVVFIQQNW